MKSETSSPQERLVVRDRENLHVLARFFQALIFNVLKKPRKVRALARLKLRVAFDPRGHPDSALVLTFANGRVILECGISPKPDIKIIAEPVVLMKLARIPAGLAVIKFLMTREGKELIARWRSGDLKIIGVAKHPLGMMKFTKFMGPSTV
jgi:hypothetical protein